METETLIRGVLLEEAALTLDELACACAVDPDWVVQRVRAGVLLAGTDAAPEHWRFTSIDLVRARRVLQVERDRGRILVEGVGMVKRHTRPNPGKQVKGGIAERESSIAISNVMIVTSGGVATRIAYRTESSGTVTRQVRIAKKGGETLDKKA